MIRFAGFTAILSLLVTLSACSGDNSDQASEPSVVADSPEDVLLTPEQTLSRLKELAQAGDWETYVDDFYGESHKFEGLAERRDAVVSRFRDKWAAQVTEGFDALDDTEAEVSDDGKKAVFMKDGQPAFNLFLDEEGRWTFHL